MKSSTKRKSHRYFSVDTKWRILEEGRSTNRAVSRVCGQYDISPTLFYQWERIAERGARQALQEQQRGRKKLAPMEKLINDQRNHILELTKCNELLRKHILANRNHEKHSHISAAEIRVVVDGIAQSPLSKKTTLEHLGIPRRKYYYWNKRLQEPANREMIDKRKPKYEIQVYKDAVFSIMHAPPKSYGYNRTTWRIKDIYQEMKCKGMNISKTYIGQIIRNEGYRFRKANKVLTSNDPQYQEKLKKITKILSHLRPDEKFFSIDEYGPFAVKKQGGRSLTALGTYKTYPQFQKSKGCVIVTGALELSTNQINHFYSVKKNTEEMIKLLDTLVQQYPDQKCLYLSWDSASWHMSKLLHQKVDEINRDMNKPNIRLVPLPACSQFLNVIESVYSGMSRAIICNSDYDSVDECKEAIDRYFKERNEFFKANPKRAGNKIWGKEKVKPEFNESNNCKDPRYSHY